jgi:hypothetical protein
MIGLLGLPGRFSLECGDLFRRFGFAVSPVGTSPETEKQEKAAK